MELIDRYLYEIGRYLPTGKRRDILAELRSSLEDALDSGGGARSEEAVAAAIRAMGPPAEVAAHYHPLQQYLIGPELYPLFRLVLGIVFTAVVGAQLLAVAVALVFSSASFDGLEVFWGILNSLPTALGFVVIVFIVLQRLEVRPELKVEPFDPYKLPRLDETEPVSRFEQIVSILVTVVILVPLAAIATEGNIGWVAGLGLFENPVLARYFPWVAVTMIAGVMIDIFLLWRGRWQRSTRLAYILVNVGSLVVLALMIRGHNAWLTEAGYTGGLFAVAELPGLIESGMQPLQLFGMVAFRLALYIASVVVTVETLVMVFRLVRSFVVRPEVGHLVPGS